jgi:dihydromethanopterin reductase (acceptor)
MKIMWGITGAGHLLKESIDVLSKINKKHEITVIFSNAGLEVVKKYGFYKKIEKIISKNSANKMVFEDDEKYSYALSGKLTYDKYDMIIISPTTANTTAKIVHGIADTLVTNVAAQSGKGQIPLIVVPVDQKEGLVTTNLPPRINKDICKKCKMCMAKSICPVQAINPPEIDTSKCIRCMKCEGCCLYDAIITNETFEIYVRRIDAENTKKLEEIENIQIVFNPEDILKNNILN